MTIGSARLRLVVSLAVAMAAGLGLAFPAEHGCRSAAARGADATADSPADHDLGHGRHRSPSSECMCVGDACGVAVAIPLSAPVLSVAPAATLAAVPIAVAADRPVTYQAHVLPFANGPPSSL